LFEVLVSESAPQGDIRQDPFTVRRWVDQTCELQGVPVAITDEHTIARVVALLASPISTATAEPAQ
jgi:hypothetical protein